MSRRDPASLAVSGQPESEIVTLFREWHALYAAYHDVLRDDDKVAAAGGLLQVIEKRIMALPSRDLADLAIKIVVESSYRAFAVDNESLFAEVEALVQPYEVPRPLRGIA